jgi:transposase-like protein
MGKPGRPSPGLDDYLYWQERLSNREASGLSIDEFCVDEGVSRTTFYRWVQRLKEGIPEAVKEEGATLTLADIAEPKFLPISVTASPVEIELPNGGLVRLPVGVGQAVIVDVIQAITGLQTRRKPRP